MAVKCISIRWTTDYHPEINGTVSQLDVLVNDKQFRAEFTDASMQQQQLGVKQLPLPPGSAIAAEHTIEVAPFISVLRDLANKIEAAIQ